jgi:hypothetical protein
VHLAWAGFENATWVVIGTDCISSYKSNYHTITITTVPLSWLPWGWRKCLYIHQLCTFVYNWYSDMKCIYANCTYLFGCVLLYGSHLFLSSAHVTKQENSKGRNYFGFKYNKTDNSSPALIGKVAPQTWNCITAGLC